MRVLSWSLQSGSNGLHTVTSVLLVCSPLSPFFPALYFDTCSAFLHASGFQVGSQISITEIRVKRPLQNYLPYLLSKHRSCLNWFENKSVYADSTLTGTKVLNNFDTLKSCGKMTIFNEHYCKISFAYRTTEKDYFFTFP